MTVNVTLTLTVGVLFACGVYLLLARSVVRALIGFVMLSTSANLLFLLAAGEPGAAPIIDGKPAFGDITDPVPQAMVLTSIVIGLCMAAFMLALAHRGWQLSRTDVLRDDEEDERIQQRALENDMSESEYQHEAEDDLGESEHPRERTRGQQPASTGATPAGPEPEEPR